MTKLANGMLLQNRESAIHRNCEVNMFAIQTSESEYFHLSGVDYFTGDRHDAQ